MPPWCAGIMRPISAADDSTVSTLLEPRVRKIVARGGENIGVAKGESDRAIWLRGE